MGLPMAVPTRPIDERASGSAGVLPRGTMLACQVRVQSQPCRRALPSVAFLIRSTLATDLHRRKRKQRATPLIQSTPSCLRTPHETCTNLLAIFRLHSFRHIQLHPHSLFNLKISICDVRRETVLAERKRMRRTGLSAFHVCHLFALIDSRGLTKHMFAPGYPLSQVCYRFEIFHRFEGATLTSALQSQIESEQIISPTPIQLPT